ncbi:hypothetical protein VNO78_12403 [Psophocarpus tetragonolobus]|uniref:Uncharacterized protein n=1 Tax=Psophocarpus tetragonolobus TaxID=3891 RepID=A0AAN9SVH4_PSOTE
MVNVRFLKIYRGYHYSEWKEQFNVYLDNGLKSLSHKLRYLCWEGFSLESLPSNFCAEQLVELCIRGSKVKKLWDGVQLHPFVSYLPKLTNLHLSYCIEIERINVHSKSLRVLTLYGCSSLNELSVTSKELTELNLSNTSIRALPSTVLQNTKLSQFWLHRYNFIDELSDDSAMGSITVKLVHLAELPRSLKELDIDDCTKLISLTKLPPSLEEFGDEPRQERIKECGVFPVYNLESRFKLLGNSNREIFDMESILQVSDNESHPKAIRVGVEDSIKEKEYCE